MYRHILLALDTETDNQLLLQRAYRFAEQHQARLTLLHVVDFIPTDSVDTANIGEGLALHQPLLMAAEHRLSELCKSMRVPSGVLIDSFVTLGAARHEIVSEAAKRKCDLIIIGHHPHRGLGHLLGHTDEAVLHHSPCDVLGINLDPA